MIARVTILSFTANALCLISDMVPHLDTLPKGLRAKEK